ncbi:2Fe-2S iron-sulfur cluster-binding protein [Litoribacillus peritrichatus]|uniref:CDP-6-deoxy-delta-3,4-glucoseen reductase n=1 Tax=Litoribacillus peritrichatus TaxID=718191 RepID=A0ABP7NDG7_9GAMM
MDRLKITTTNGHTFLCREDQVVLDAALEQHCFIPKGCINGVCEVCYGDLLQGTVALNSGLEISAPPTQKNVLYCIAKPLTDLHIGIKAFRGPGEYKLQTIACQIELLQPLNHDTYQVQLLAPAGKSPEFHAGQYLELLPEDGKSYPFTIACAPQGRSIELHIQVHEDNLSAQYILEQLTSQTLMRVKMPMGNCFLPIERHELKQDVLLIAAGTGYAQMKSIIEACANDDTVTDENKPKLHLFWVGKKPEDLYLSQQAQALHEQGVIQYFPIVRDTNQGWDGYSGLIEDLILANFKDLSQCSAFFCGSPNFVYGIFDALQEDGLTMENCYSDVFDYAPRN